MAQETNGNSTVILSATPQAGAAVHQNALPIGTLIGEFEIIDLVGEGGFGIVYLAQDHSLHRKVALKEYMPASLASRAPDSSVTVRSERHRETFGIGLRSFVNEARILAQYDHAALVKVYRFWEANGTAYMVMPFFSGKTLQDELKTRDVAPEEAWIRKILSPVMEALAIIHADNCFHRDIAPDNIMLLANDRPVLLDFGAARRVISDMTQALTVILKPGYAPIEQYAEMPGMKQGPWTDVYALAAVVYFMILNRKPPPSVGRMMQDTYEPLGVSQMVGKYSQRFLDGIDKCLSVKAEDRPQSIAEMREIIGFGSSAGTSELLPKAKQEAKPAAPQSAEPSFSSHPLAGSLPDSLPDAMSKKGQGSSPKSLPKAPPARVSPPADEDENVEKKRSSVPLIAGAGFVIAALAGGYFYFTKQQGSSPPVATITAPTITPAIKAPVAAPAPQRFATLAEALDGALAASDKRLALKLEAPASITAGSELKLSATSTTDGFLYVFVWDQADDKIYRLYPNEKDGGAGANAVKANASHTVPHNKPETWRFAAKEPLGNWRVFSLLSEKSRDFGSTAFAREGDFSVTDRKMLEAKLSTSGLASLFGAAQCATGETCPDNFVISTLNIAEVAPPPPAAPVPPVAKPAAPIKAAPPAGTQNKKTPDSEREYMKRLNKDLDNLLGQ